MAGDTYGSFDDLMRNETLDTDYIISISDVGSPVTIIAPHGGKIEPRTAYIARSIARNKFNYYCFEGIKTHNNRRLHITSPNFDEPAALELVARSAIVVAVHACTDRDSRVYLGGLHQTLMACLAKALKAQRIVVAEENYKYGGRNPANICNRGSNGKGVQLEISRGLRDNLTQVHVLTDTIHAALKRFLKF
jgi:phage replication-related protein YjqB (UPF0714/DUF867 family)